MARARSASSGGDAIIGRTTRVRGRITGDGDLVVDGIVEGDISVRGDLTIGEGAKATCHDRGIDAHAVTVRGELDGDVSARGIVRLEAGARVRGDIRGESVAIEEGAEFSGRLESEFELPPELGGAPVGDASRRRRG
jgi:cytoskeletal protein CcmA (bactofilin family)